MPNTPSQAPPRAHRCLAGVANAVFAATGLRIRELPITPEKLVSPVT
jgi:CO/xanthine dehydrogenase Mo-binding subunit